MDSRPWRQGCASDDRTHRKGSCETTRSYTISSGAKSMGAGKPLNTNHMAKQQDLKEGSCATLFQTVRKSLILKRRDAGAVDQARLEIDSARAC